jgi:thioredoxin 1
LKPEQVLKGVSSGLVQVERSDINMAMTEKFMAVEPARAEIDALHGPTMLEFGAPWCGYCQASQPLLAAALAGHPQVRHLKIEDGKGRPLGRSFGVTQWPSLIFLSAGKEVARLVRPVQVGAIAEALAQID